MTITTVLLALVAAYLGVKLIGALIFAVFLALLVLSWLQTLTIVSKRSIWGADGRVANWLTSVPRVHLFYAACLLLSIVVFPYVEWLFIFIDLALVYFVYGTFNRGVPFYSFKGRL